METHTHSRAFRCVGLIRAVFPFCLFHSEQPRAPIPSACQTAFHQIEWLNSDIRARSTEKYRAIKHDKSKQHKIIVDTASKEIVKRDSDINEPTDSQEIRSKSSNIAAKLRPAIRNACPSAILSSAAFKQPYAFVLSSGPIG